jgi:YjbE family integral membrane protein
MLQSVMTELGQLMSTGWWQANFVALLNVIMIDLVLAGDNAIVVGLAASRVAPDIRAKVIFWGIAGAVVLRILFALVASQLLAIIGLTLAGGLLLLFVCWKMYKEIGSPGSAHEAAGEDSPDYTGATAAGAASLGFGSALLQIILADLTMSLDNVLAVAGAAKGSPLVLVLGLAVAIIMMAVASHYIAKLLSTYPWISYIGLAIIVWVAVSMIYKGTHEVACTGFGACTQKAMLILPGLG